MHTIRDSLSDGDILCRIAEGNFCGCTVLLNTDLIDAASCAAVRVSTEPEYVVGLLVGINLSSYHRYILGGNGTTLLTADSAEAILQAAVGRRDDIRHICYKCRVGHNPVTSERKRAKSRHYSKKPHSTLIISVCRDLCNWS